MTQIKTAGLFQFEGEKKYSPISLEYFLDMELAMGGEGKLIMKDGGRLKTIRESEFKNNGKITKEENSSNRANP